MYRPFCFVNGNLMIDDQLWMNQKYMPSCYREQKDTHLHPFISMLSGCCALCAVVDARNSGATKQERSPPSLNLRSSERRQKQINKVIIDSEEFYESNKYSHLIKSNFIKW